MSLQKTISDSNPVERRHDTSLFFRRPWVAAVYLLSVAVSCILMSFIMMPGSMFAIIEVVSITIMPTVVLLTALRWVGAERSAFLAAPFASEGATEEWETDESGDDVEVDGIGGDAAPTARAPLDG